jgi:uncharacterized membrane protein
MFSLGPFELVILLGIVPWAITLWALVDAIRVPSDHDFRAGTKLIWVLVILLLNCIGALIYFLVGKPVSSGARY